MRLLKNASGQIDGSTRGAGATSMKSFERFTTSDLEAKHRLVGSQKTDCRAACVLVDGSRGIRIQPDIAS